MLLRLYGFGRITGTIGELFDASDLETLRLAGHEIGAHTNRHLDCAKATVEDSLADLQDNLNALRKMDYTLPVSQFAYPYGETRVSLKRKLIDRVVCARGNVPGINRCGADLMQLRAYGLSPDDSSTARAVAAIEAAARQPGWVIIYTHDVPLTMGQ